MNDEDLIRQFVKLGDEDAFETLVRKRLPALRRIVAAAGPREAADRDDLLQEVLIRLHSALGSYRFEAPLSTWIYRIARNAALDAEKHRRRAADRELRAVKSTDLPENRPGPEELALESTRTDELRNLFYRLRESDRQLLLLREKEGLSMEEIAGILNLPRGTVKSRLSRARSRARKLYREAGI